MVKVRDICLQALAVMLCMVPVSLGADAFTSTWTLRTSSFNYNTGAIILTTPVGQANVETVNFNRLKQDLGANLPDDIQALRDFFHVSYTSTLRAQVTGTHRFTVTCDDGCRAYVDDSLVTATGAWRLQGSTEYHFSVDMVAGESHPFELQVFEQSGHFTAILEVIPPGASDRVLVNSDISTPRFPGSPTTFVFGGRAHRVAGTPSTEAAAAPVAGEACHGADKGPVEVPAGFSVAADDGVSAALASRYPFAATCLLVASGKALRTRRLAGEELYCSEAEAGTLAEGTNGDGDATVDVSGDTGCTTRVLLAADIAQLSGDDATAAAAATDAASAWGADSSQGQVRALSFRGKLYASLHNAAPSSATASADAASCVPSGLFAVPSGGWAVAPDNAESRAAVLGLRNTFASTCLVLAGGASIDSVSGAACPAVSAPTADLGVTAAGYLSVSSCPHSVLLVYDPASPNAVSSTPAGTSAATSVESWDADVLVTSPPTVPTSAIEVRGTQFTATTGLATRKRGKVCQDVAIRVPSGWSVLSATGATPEETATLEDRFSDAARFAAFGTYCLGRAGGIGKRASNRKRLTCGATSDVVSVTLDDGTAYAAVTSCPAAVTLTRPKPPPGPNELCGVCIGWGDPHFTTYDGAKWDFYGKGEYWVTAAYEDKHPDPAERTIDWSVRSLQEPVRSATKHSMLRVTYKGTAVEVRVQDGNRAAEPTLSLAGTVTDLADGASTTIANSIEVSRKGTGVTGNRAKRTTYRIVLPNAVVVEIRGGFWNLNLLDIRVELPNRYSGVTAGLCGTCDGDKSNDFSSPNCGTGVNYDTYKGLSRRVKISTAHPHGETWAIGEDGNHAKGTCGFPPDDTTEDPGSPVDGGGPPTDLPCDLVEADVAARAVAACASIADDALRTACEDDVCATGDDGAAGPAKETETGEGEDTAGPAPACSAPTITNTVGGDDGTTMTHNGFEYALLDNTDPDSSAVGCQEDSLRVPDGWIVAPDTPIHRSALACHPWATECVILASGSSYTSSLTACGTFEIETTGPENECLVPTTCSRRILLVRDAPRADILPTSFLSPTSGGPVVNTASAGWADASTYAGGASSLTVVTDDSWSGRLGTGSVRFAGSPATAPEAGAVLLVGVGSAASGNPTGQQATYLSRARLGRGFSVAAMSKSVIDPGGAVSNDYSIYVDVIYENGAISSSVARFPTGVHDWVRRSVDVVVDLDPTTGRPVPVDEIRIFLLYRNRAGDVSFSDVSVDILSPAPFNLLVNGFAQVGTPGWLLLSSQPDDNDTTPLASVSTAGGTSDPFTGSITVDTTGVGADAIETTSAGMYQGVNLPANGGLTRAFGSNDPSHTALYFGADVRTVAGEAPSAYGSYRSVYVDATLADTTNEYGVFEPVHPSPADGDQARDGGPVWQRIERVHAYGTSVNSFTLNTLVRHTTTNTAFDGLYATPSCARGARVNPDNGFSHGDPHVRSLDATPEGPEGWFDVHNIGEFVFFQDPVSEIQVRHSVAGRASVNSAFFVRTDLMTVQIDRSTGKMAPVIRINGRVSVATSITIDDPSSGAYVTLVTRGDIASAEASASYEISVFFPGTHPTAVEAETGGKPLEHFFTITAHRTSTGTQFLQAFIKVPSEYAGRTTGLLGNFDGNPNNDLNLPDGTANTDPAVFARAWEVDPTTAASYFVHSAAEDASKIRDPSFVAASAADIPADELQAARQECIRRGIRATALVRDCAFDVFAGGSSFALSSGTARTQEALPVGSDVEGLVNTEDSAANSDGDSDSSPAGRVAVSQAMIFVASVAVATFLF